VGEFKHGNTAGLLPSLDGDEPVFGVHRDHNPPCAMFAADLFHHIWVVYRGGANNNPVDAGLQPGVGGGHVPDAATHLDRDVQAADDG